MSAVDVSVELQEGETFVAAGELVLRQICDWMVMGGKLQTRVFGPSTSDKGMPSYAREVPSGGPQAARDWHNEHAPSTSVAVMGLTVDEVHEEELMVIDDTASPLREGEKRAPGHCFVDFRSLDKATERTLRARLFQKAVKRGVLPTVNQIDSATLF